MRILPICLFLIIAVSSPIFSQVGVGTTVPEGALDITSADSGILIPRVALTTTTLAAPVVNPRGAFPLVAGTLVYNTAIDGVSPNNVAPGFYYWDGTKWVTMAGTAAATNDWSLLGNAGTNPATNYIGTSDAQDLQIRTGGGNKFKIPNLTNQIQGYGGTAASPTYSWQANPSYGMWLSGTNVRFSSAGTARFQIPNADQVHGLVDGTAALPFYSWINATSTGMFKIGANATAQLAFATNGLERVRILETGNIGLGMTTPKTKVEIAGAVSVNEGTALNFVAGTNDNVSLGMTPFSMYRITGPTAAFNLTGIVPASGANGQIVTVENTTAFPMTIMHDVTSVAANRIFCPGAKNLVLIGQYSTVTLQYNASQSRWIITGYVGEAASVNQREIYSVKGTTDIAISPAIYPASGTFSDMSQMTLTVTPKNSVIYINFGASGDLSVSPIPGANNIGFRLVNATTSAVLGGTVSISTDYDFDDVYGEIVATGWNAHLTMFPVTVTPGVPVTLKIQWVAEAIFGAPAHNYVSSTPSYAHRNFTIID
jgi:hypothetical protein